MSGLGAPARMPMPSSERPTSARDARVSLPCAIRSSIASVVMTVTSNASPASIRFFSDAVEPNWIARGRPIVCSICDWSASVLPFMPFDTSARIEVGCRKASAVATTAARMRTVIGSLPIHRGMYLLRSAGNCRPSLARRRSAHKARHIVDAAGPFVLRDLRIWTERARAIDLPTRDVGRDQHLRSLAVFNPLLERANLVEHARAFSTAAVTHPGRQEQPDVVGRLALSAEILDDALVVLDCVERWNLGVAPSVVQEQLPAA